MRNKKNTKREQKEDPGKVVAGRWQPDPSVLQGKVVAGHYKLFTETNPNVVL